MSYAKLAESDLKEGISATKEAIESCHRLLHLSSKNPEVKGLQKVAKSAAKDIQKLEKDVAKLEKALRSSSPR